MSYTGPEESWETKSEWAQLEEEEEVDVSREFTCFLCNGQMTMLGSVVINSGGITLISAAGLILESDPVSVIVSVNELEPPRDHALFIVFKDRYVMVTHLLRKEKLVQFFKDVGVYKDDLRIPAEAIGYYEPELLNQNIDRSDHSSPSSSSPYSTTTTSYPSYSTAMYQDEDRGGTRMSQHTRSDVIYVDVASGTYHCPHCNRHHHLPQHPHLQQPQVSYNFSYNNTRALKQMNKEPPTQLPQTDPFPNLTPAPSSSSPSQSPTSWQKEAQPREEEKQVDKSSLLSGLKMLFPSHPEDRLRSVLEEEEYNMDNAITSLLQHNELANAPGKK